MRSEETHFFEGVQPQMGTLAAIRLYAPNAATARAAMRKAFARISELDAILSDYREDSELNWFCRAAGTGPVRVSADLFRVLAVSKQMAELSQAWFDITLGKLTALWRLAKRRECLPSQAVVQECGRYRGMDKLRLNEALQTAELAEAGMQLDVGAIGKGYAAEEALAVLRSEGISQALVAMSGDLAYGEAPPGRAGWQIRAGGEERRRVLTRINGAACTSGSTEQYFTLGGVRYSHILNPKTGWPLNGQARVTVVGPNAMQAEALATALCCFQSGAARDQLDGVYEAEEAAVLFSHSIR